MAGTEQEWNELKNKQIGGKHYETMMLEPIIVMQQWLDKSEYRGFLIGNIIKYIGRYKLKNGKEDLLKARDYLDRLINSL